MKIAVIGWGSLIWNKRELEIKPDMWFPDGPNLPVEFARISNDNRLTLVLLPNTKPVNTRYAISAFDSIEEARQNLREREGPPNIDSIGYYNFRDKSSSSNIATDVVLSELERWNSGKNFDAVVWTDLPSNFSKKRGGATLNTKSLNKFFHDLQPEEFEAAKKYIDNAPSQVKTALREPNVKIISQLERD